MSDTVSIQGLSTCGVDYQVTARVESRSERGVVVGGLKSLKKGALVSVRDEQGVYRAVVRGPGTQTDPTGSVELVYVEDGRRREPRHGTGGMARVSWDTGGRTLATAADAEVCNVSESGLQLSTPEPIHRGSLVRIRGESFDCSGQARYCTKDGDRYRVGVEFVRPPVFKD